MVRSRREVEGSWEAVVARVEVMEVVRLEVVEGVEEARKVVVEP